MNNTNTLTPISQSVYQSNCKKVQKLISILNRNLGEFSVSYSCVMEPMADEELQFSMINRILFLLKQTKLAKCKAEYDLCSTAMFPQYNNYWTIGSWGSIFVDIKMSVPFNDNEMSFRIHYLHKKNTNYKKDAIYIESLD